MGEAEDDGAFPAEPREVAPVGSVMGEAVEVVAAGGAEQRRLGGHEIRQDGAGDGTPCPADPPEGEEVPEDGEPLQDGEEGGAGEA